MTNLEDLEKRTRFACDWQHVAHILTDLIAHLRAVLPPAPASVEGQVCGVAWSMGGKENQSLRCRLAKGHAEAHFADVPGDSWQWSSIDPAPAPEVPGCAACKGTRMIVVSGGPGLIGSRMAPCPECASREMVDLIEAQRAHRKPSPEPAAPGSVDELVHRADAEMGALHTELASLNAVVEGLTAERDHYRATHATISAERPAEAPAALLDYVSKMTPEERARFTGCASMMQPGVVTLHNPPPASADVEDRATCRHYEEDDSGAQIGEPCGKPAKWLSCQSADGIPSCDEHMCRCKKVNPANPPESPDSSAPAVAGACSVRVSRVNIMGVDSWSIYIGDEYVIGHDEECVAEDAADVLRTALAPLLRGEYMRGVNDTASVVRNSVQYVARGVGYEDVAARIKVDVMKAISALLAPAARGPK